MAHTSLATADARSAPRLRSWLPHWDAARLAIPTVFLADGLAFGTCVVQLPLLKHGLGLSDLALAAALAGLVGGAFVAMPHRTSPSRSLRSISRRCSGRYPPR